MLVFGTMASVMMEHKPSAVAAVPGSSSSDKQLTAAYPPSSPREALIATERTAVARARAQTRGDHGTALPESGSAASNGPWGKENKCDTGRAVSWKGVGTVEGTRRRPVTRM